ncbi:MAG TPA: hypothetical protein PLJ16_02010 [Casimicrobium huifangae]|nr:hypothetical protein [Casimicrobium huifangae]HQA33750.1 hypothetical protein [Casimicrobium huifangae]HQD63972.1 hypothetical protein [Casimicrobium huifangae]
MSKHRLPFVARILSSALLAAAAISLPGVTVAQTVAALPATATAAAPATTPAPAPRVFALVAAVGDQFQYVRQKESVGSNFIDNHTRQTLKVPDHSLNYAVLRGLDRAVELDYPGAERVLLAVKGVPEIQAALPQDREALTMKHVLGVLEANPARKDWDQIIVVVPKWLMSGRQGIGGKLTGIGVYVQPLGEEMDKSGDFVDDVVEDTAREQVRSRRFVAPYFYVQVTTLDAKTLKVIKSESRYDFRKIVDKESTALDVAAQFTPEQLASHMQRFVETSALKAVNEKADTGTVQVGPVKTVSTEPAKK